MRYIFAFFLLMGYTQSVYSQEPSGDTIRLESEKDSVLVAILDTSFLSKIDTLSQQSSYLFTQDNIIFKTSIEFLKNTNPRKWIFYWVLVSIVMFFFIKILYSRDFQQFVSQLFETTTLQQFSRIKGINLSLFDLLLISFAVINLSILIAFSFALNALSAVITAFSIAFLFTFFITIKVVFVRLLGVVFEEQDTTASYLFYFFQTIQIVGVAAFPAVAFLSLQTKINIHTIATYLISILIVGLLYFVFKGLSTMANLLYKSVYHFLLYICVGEILSVFFFLSNC
jgi:hypothetical protein